MDLEKSLDEALDKVARKNQGALAKQQKRRGGKLALLAGTGDQLDNVPLWGRTRARGIRIHDAHMELAGAPAAVQEELGAKKPRKARKGKKHTAPRPKRAKKGYKKSTVTKAAKPRKARKAKGAGKRRAQPRRTRR